jgi:hypothetical protein
MVGHERVGEGQAGDSGEQGERGVDAPDNAQGADLAGVVFDLESKAGNLGNRSRGRPAALRANRLSGGEGLTTSTAIHDASNRANRQKYGSRAKKVPKRV